MRRAVDPSLALKLVAIVGAMFAFGFALVPLYDAFCSLTGFGGKTAGIASAAQLDVKPDKSRIVRVELVASLPRGAPWEFAPNETHLDVHPGELYVTHFHAQNLTGRALVAQAVPSIAPGTAARHFRKTECFCFAQQAFEPHESRELKVAFMVTPDLPAEIETLSLAYTFFTVSQ